MNVQETLLTKKEKNSIKMARKRGRQRSARALIRSFRPNAAKASSALRDDKRRFKNIKKKWEKDSWDKVFLSIRLKTSGKLFQTLEGRPSPVLRPSFRWCRPPGSRPEGKGEPSAGSFPCSLPSGTCPSRTARGCRWSRWWICCWCCGQWGEG